MSQHRGRREHCDVSQWRAIGEQRDTNQYTDRRSA